MKRILLAIALLGLGVAAPINADTIYPTRGKMVSEKALRQFSDRQYLEIIAGSLAAGRHYTAIQIASGLKRHFTEWRARFIDAGYTIIGESGEI